MKRFWLILLSLGLIVAFSTSAMAVDVKFSGEYYAAGLYMDKVSLNKTAYTYYRYLPTGAAMPNPQYALTPLTQKNDDTSTAFYFQRLRLNTTFVVSPGLMLITRADIMERAWGATRSSTRGVATMSSTNTVLGYTDAPADTMSAGTRAENENIAFDLAYIQYVSPIGIFLAGYQIDGAWGTVFGDTSMPTPKIGYIIKVGNVLAGIQAGKNPDGEKSYGAFNGSVKDAVDRDNNFYTGLVKYLWKGGEAGLLVKYISNTANRNLLAAAVPDTGYTQEVWVAVPYVKAQLGPVALQAEFTYAGGKIKWEGRPDLIPYNPAYGLPGPKESQDIYNIDAWIDATADFGMVYVGGTAAYVSGDNPDTTGKLEGGVLNGGLDWNPCLIMFNTDLAYWTGTQAGYAAVTGVSNTANGAPMSNAFFAQLRGGIRPVDKLDIMASVSWAKAEKTPASVWVGREYGYEVDLTGTYKITNNLSYMLGAAYFFTGDYYKGASDANEVDDNFMVINKLTLTF